MRSRRALALGIMIALAIVLGVVYYFFDPVEVRWMPQCLWRVATGTDCPGCGSQRMAHALVHGDISGAWHANAYALCLLPLIGFMFWLEIAREKYPKLYKKVHAPWVICALASSVMIWWILRNVI